ncbi:hypothetical protein INR77_01135 [Erythrobacter sp. SCSIO 43205]|uniref:hypothetical protein n=1 Tax=Erythrobacter sp. SCSIO 43205 TaxID=2779361 RepID=UPI001CA7F33C|nr:hypothetical protein [Erythrobacter sp. SCSIO 43205]UAB78382.1 hypothetical protein INR77_01135 [Erythrobacter sp. SCSIO 43205]
MASQTPTLHQRIEARANAAIDPAVAEFARSLADDAGAKAVLFYGSNLRTGSLEGVLDFYILLPGEQRERIWPRVSYQEREAADGTPLRAKIATMALSTFAKAASGELLDTTIWARFVQPSALIWAADDTARGQVIEAIACAAQTAARLTVALGPPSGTAEEYWRALFRATYKAEFRVEKAGRENDILSVNAEHFDGLLPLALTAAGIAHTVTNGRITPALTQRERSHILKWWKRRAKLGKPLNFTRLIKASTTFEGAARYAAWKVERHTGMSVEVTPFREKHPLLAAPSVLWQLRKHRRTHKG